MVEGIDDSNGGDGAPCNYQDVHHQVIDGHAVHLAQWWLFQFNKLQIMIKWNDSGIKYHLSLLLRNFLAMNSYRRISISFILCSMSLFWPPIAFAYPWAFFSKRDGHKWGSQTLKLEMIYFFREPSLIFVGAVLMT
jgi:hypothetical protein